MAIKQERINSAADPEPASDYVEVANERFAHRRECDLPASILLPDRGVVVPCRVKDMSATGAGIVLPVEQLGGHFSGRTLPDKFWLRLARDGSEVCCRVAWQIQDRYGLRFVSPMQPVARQRRVKQKEPAKKSGLFGLMRA
jgi:hypothetical protein